MLRSQSRFLGQASSCCTPSRALAPSAAPRLACPVSQHGSLFSSAAVAAAAVSPAPAMTHRQTDAPRISNGAGTSSRQRASVTTQATAVATAPTVAPTPAPATSRRGRSKTSSPTGPSPGSLRTVPGVGPKNESLLKENGLQTVDQLRLLHAKNGGNTEATRAYLQDTVGIRNKGHLSSILEYLASQSPAQGHGGAPPMTDSQQEQLHGSSMEARLSALSQQAAKVTLSVEGNISAGKSTFLRMLRESIQEEELKVVPEPVDKWQNVGDGKVNLLMEFYRNPERFAYTFQNYVFLTRMVQERDSYSQSMCRLLERSVFSDRMVFVRAVHKSKFMNDTELAIYDSWFNPVVATLPTLVPNGFIYLRANPETCHRRMKKRSRSEESTVELEYLQGLHQHHEDWLWSGGAKATSSKHLYIPQSNQVLTNSSPSGVDPATGPPPPGSPSLQLLQPHQATLSYEVPPVPSELRDTLYLLDANKQKHMLHHLHQVPALVIDCDADVDVEHDQQYRQHVAQQVQLYTAYVRDLMRAKANAHQAASANAPFGGYHYPDANGNITYTDPSFHLMAHSDAMQRRGVVAAGARN